MNAVPRLRARLLSALAASSITAALAASSGCGSIVVTSGSGGGGSGSTSTSGGTTATGGTITTTTTTGGGGSTDNCFTDEIGTCCYSTSCYTKGELAKFTLDGMVPIDCPDAASLSTQEICWWFASGPTVDGDNCCYEMGSGDCCGRPFTVSGKARRAEVGRRADWAFAMEPVETLDLGTRAALAEAWLTDARMEHASIASFARFTLHLLALGAPPALVEGSQQASLDEVEHARACFALASRYSGNAAGPGPLAMDGALGGVDLVEAAVAAVREGCVGETIAAAVAAEQLAIAEDSDVRRALERITRDEEAHAELSWRFVKWAIDRGGEPVRAAVSLVFQEILASEPAKVSIVTETIDMQAWHRHGRLTRAEMDRVKTLVLRDVIAPCAEALSTGAAPRVS